MASFVFENVCIESYDLLLPPHEVTTAEIEDKLAPLYKELNLPLGTLKRLSGIEKRYFFDEGATPSQMATECGRRALEGIGFDRREVKTVFNCSVARDFFEPATAVLVHRNLEFSEDAMAMDITNACIGFSNGMLTLATMIEAGMVQAGLVVAAENLQHIFDASYKLLLEGNRNGLNIDRAKLLKALPTFTLGCGAVAMVLCHKGLATKGHRVVGSVASTASQHSELCIGNGDFTFNQQEGLNPLMQTDSRPLIASAAKLGARVWNDASRVLGWSTEDIDHIFCHQVGSQVNEGFYQTMGLPYDKEHTVYQRYGNMVSAAMPSAFFTGAAEGLLKKDERILLTAFGSGLNAIFTGVVW